VLKWVMMISSIILVYQIVGGCNLLGNTLGAATLFAILRC
jgi:hypothetical protein